MAVNPRNGGSETERARSGTPEAARSATQTGGEQAATQQQETQQRGQRLPTQRSRGGLARGFGASPASMFLQLSREMDRLMDSFFDRSFGFGSSLFPSFGRAFDDDSGAPTLWSPRVDVRQRGDSIVVCADLPGVRKEDITIEATDGGLAISGERREEREESDEQQGYRYAERSYGRFYRMIPLPEGADVDQAKATMRDGVLEVTIPAPQSSKRRRITIEQ